MKRTVAILVLPAALAIGACGDDDQTDARAATCEGEFEATVRDGPSAGASFQGDMSLSIQESGSASGLVVRNGGPAVRVVGQVDGRAISFAIDLSGDRTLYGSGAALEEISDCTGEMGGSLSGPERGDSGDWRYTLGG